MLLLIVVDVDDDVVGVDGDNVDFHGDFVSSSPL